MLQRDPDLLERLEECAQRPFTGIVHRVVWADGSPLRGSSLAGGRWNSPDGSFEVLNTSLEAEGAGAEFEAFWSLFEQRPDKAALIWTVRARLRQVVELDFDLLDELGVQRESYVSRQYARTQEISDGLSYLGCDGVIVPSARHDSRNLVIYMQNLHRESSVEEDGSLTFVWSDQPGGRNAFDDGAGTLR